MTNQTSLKDNFSNDKARWDSLQQSLLGLYGKDVYTSWLQNISFTKINFNTLVLNVKTRFIRDWIVAHYADKILDLYKKQDANITRIEFQISERVETKSNSKSNVIDFEKKDFIQDSGSYGLSKIDERLVFDNFIVGKSNELAFTAANRIIDNLNKYNPLYIYGGVGLGKTHLLNAIGNKLLKKLDKVIYVSAERFMYQFVRSIKNNDVVKFKDIFRSAKVLIIDDYGTCYYILNFSGEAPVGRLTFVGASGSCSSPTCVTTTTTQAPFCNTWVVENVSENSAGEIYKVKYCGDNFFSYPQVYFGYPQTVCVQNDEISNPFFNRVALTNLSQSCQTTTTTTLAPGCSTFVITNNGDFFTYVGDYVYCGNNFSSSYSVGTNSTVRLCVQDGKIDLPSGFNYVIQISGSCNATTTTTTTLAPGCYLATIINNNIGTTFLGDYVYCGTSVLSSTAPG